MPLIWLSLAFLGGILLSPFLGWSIKTWLCLAGLCLVLLASSILLARLSTFSPQPFSVFTARRRRPSSMPPLPLLGLVLALGAARYIVAQPVLSPASLAWYNDQAAAVILEGVLIEPPDERDSQTNLRVRVENLRAIDAELAIPVAGLLLAQAPPRGNWQYGDRLQLTGRLQTPPEEEDFSYREYLARQGVYSYMPRARVEWLSGGEGSWFLARLYSLKARLLQMVYALFPDPEASLLAGILLGVDQGIPQAVQEAFKATGTSHIIAISGFNMTIVAALFVAFFGGLLGPRRGALAAALGIALYTLLVGASPAVTRAALMGGLGLLARQIGRRQDGLNSLACVAALLALFNPQVLWDIGFQLSFLATLGLVLYAGPFSQGFIHLSSRFLPLTAVERLAGPVGEYFLFTLAAQLTTLPVILYHFQRLSLVSFLANPIILPAQPAVMVLGGAAVLLGLLWQPLGQAAAYLAWPFVVYTIRAVEWFARAPGGLLAVGEISLGMVLAFYACLFLVTFARPRLQQTLTPARLAVLWKPSLGLAILGAASIVVWQAAWAAPDGRLHLALLDVGMGDALYVRTPSGRSLLVDGGPSASRLSDALGRRLPLGRRKLDWLVVAATGDEQLAALPNTLQRFPPDQVLWAGSAAGSRAARDLQAALAEEQIPVNLAEPGQVLDLGQGAMLQVLAVSQQGMVVLLEWESFHALLPVGLDTESLGHLIQEHHLVPVEVLLLADSGSAELNPPQWIQELRPQLALISVEAGNKRGLPAAETLQAIDGYSVLRTDRNGWIEISTDGERMWVEAENK